VKCHFNECQSDEILGKIKLFPGQQIYCIPLGKNISLRRIPQRQEYQLYVIRLHPAMKNVMNITKFVKKPAC
jgi:hypothetical protein